MVFGKKQFLSLIAVGCGLWSVSIYSQLFRNNTKKDVYVKVSSDSMKRDGKDELVVKAKDFLDVRMYGMVLDSFKGMPFNYAYVIPGQIPQKMKLARVKELKTNAGININKTAEIVFTESNDDWAPQAYAAMKTEPAPAAPPAPHPSYESGDRKASVASSTSSEVSRTAGSSTAASPAPGSPKRSAGSTMKSSCH